LLVGTVDNVLRPVFMRGGASHLHGAAIFFSLMGGILAFGAMGLVVGPMGLVFFMAMAKAVTRSWKRSSAGSPGALP
jgi:predicted PurR-regulated permease PerM